MKRKESEKVGVIMVKMRSAVVVGATGLVGSELVKQLCDNPYYISVTTLTRRPFSFSHKKLTKQIVDFDGLQERDFGYAEDVFCCLGTTRKKAGTREEFEKVDVEYPLRVAQIAKKLGANHFIVISAMGANERSAAYYNRVKGKLEKELMELELSRLSIVRPSLLVGKRDEFRFGEKMGEGALKVLNPALFGPLKKYRSIEASQVAEAMIWIALYSERAAVAVYESGHLAQLKLPPVEEVFQQTGERGFDWSKLDDDVPPLDEEVVFDRSKIKTVDDKPLRDEQ